MGDRERENRHRERERTTGMGGERERMMGERALRALMSEIFPSRVLWIF